MVYGRLVDAVRPIPGHARQAELWSGFSIEHGSGAATYPCVKSYLMGAPADFAIEPVVGGKRSKTGAVCSINCPRSTSILNRERRLE